MWSAYTVSRLCLQLVGRSAMGQRQQKRQKSNFLRNFKWLFTSQGWLWSARNFGKTHFRQFANFQFLMPEILWFCFFLQNNFGGWILLLEKWRFGGATKFLSVTGRSLVKSYCLKCFYFWGRLPWRGSKRFNMTMCRNLWLGTETHFNHLVLRCSDNMLCRYW